MPEIICNENHEYYVDGVRKPGVTRILQDMGLIDFSGVPADIMECAQKFGTAVHTATELDDNNDLDFKTLDPALVPYIEAWHKFKSENGVEILGIETNHYNPIYQYCGKDDRLAIVRSERTVIDIKTSTSMAAATKMQLAGYALFYEPVKVKRLGVQLKGDGTYKLHPYNSYGDRNTFLYAVSLWWWRANNKLIKGW